MAWRRVGRAHSKLGSSFSPVNERWREASEFGVIFDFSRLACCSDILLSTPNKFVDATAKIIPGARLFIIHSCTRPLRRARRDGAFLCPGAGEYIWVKKVDDFAM